MRRLVRELCKEKLSWNSFTLLEIVWGFSLTQASWSPVRSEEPESRWRYSSQFSLLRTYSAITAPRTPACINKTEYVSIAASCLESINCVHVSLSNLRFKHSQQWVRLWNLLELAGLVSAQTNDITQSLRCIWLPLCWAKIKQTTITSGHSVLWMVSLWIKAMAHF